ncbi:MAG: ATP-binding cassette domain-containing protein [Deltaproteobacteria bacterium]|nr:ATP-binding cassette domain-containing protein [Deltaproteobacteria bacterium]
MPVIQANRLSRSFKVPVRKDGVGGTLKHFFKREYKHTDAVKDVSFRVEPGERVGFLGQNGAGKTTTLKMLSGLLLPTGGDAVVCGFTPFDKKPAFLKQIALVMGNKQQLLWDLPAKDTFQLNAAIYGIDDVEMRKRVGELASMLELTTLLDQPVRKLSLGERMKCELLASLLHQPKVLFLDEPTLGLDVNAQVAVRDFLKRYNEATGATILLTSHYMADITALCSRVLVIHEGQLVFDGDLTDLTARFQPKKEILIKLDRPVTDDDVALIVVPGVVHTSTEGRVAHFVVEPAALTETLGRILQKLEPKDLSVQDPPIEEIIGRAIRGEKGQETKPSSSSSSSAPA